MIQSTPLPRRSAEEQARLETTLREVFEHKLCFNELLGFKVESLDPLEPKIKPDVKAMQSRPPSSRGRPPGVPLPTVPNTASPS